MEDQVDSLESQHEAPSDTARSRIPRRFRWLVIPAAFSWCFGGVALVAVPFGIYHTIEDLPIDPEASQHKRAWTYRSLMMVPAMAICGCLNIIAGNHWLRGRWIPALIFNACGYAVLFVPDIVIAIDMPNVL